MSSAPEISSVGNQLKPVIKCQQKMFDDNIFRFLNKEFSVKTSEDWNADGQDRLWLYNLHYFDDLNAVSSEQRIDWHYDLIQKWIDENPPGFKNGWEPYPSSLRIVNWVKWFLLNSNLKQEWLDSLASQTRFLSQNLEYHLLGNHLFANAKALIFAGLYFQGTEADEWYQTGMKILNKELPEQVLADGGNFELSPMYHAIFLEDLLDLINIHQVYDKSQPANIATKAVQMLEWLGVMCHPDGEISFFNDSTLGVAPTISELTDYAKQLDLGYKDRELSDLTHLQKSGYIRLEKKGLTVIADVAKIGPDYIPGHGHADALSFEISLFGERLIVNSGISTYNTSLERQKQRGTLSHSTITVDDIDSSEVWSGFRVAKRANIFSVINIKADDNFKFSACHDGYKRLKGKIVHCREWSASENLLEIVDKITGNGEHKITSVLPLHPNTVVSNVRNNSVDLKIKENKIKVHFEGNGVLQVVSSQYHPEFGLSIDNKQLVYSYNGDLPFKITIKISW
ncbi:heparinase II/III family protein [Candidatus Thioglobus sp.]|nr:heparinase II/III family protein [Candidatus Thioglobus sp.]